ncbi:MAG TPA: ABC transporter permease, partial [Acidimicrobiales bacterium]|nr:ABC transporter permease [Acidimicrobiales bacterium]
QQSYQLVPALISETSSVRVLGVAITYDELAVMGTAAVAALGLWLLFYRTRAGVAMRAVVDDPELLALAGASPARRAQSGWMLGSAFAAAGGVLLATTDSLSLNATTLTLAVLGAYAAAVIGRLRSVPLTFLGALVVGCAVSFSSADYLPQGLQTDLKLTQTVPMILLLVALVFLPHGRLRTARQVPALRLPVASLKTSIVAGLGLFLVAIPVSGALSGGNVILAARGVTLAIVMLSLVPLTGYAGQISCAQLTFAGLGAFAMGKIAGGASPLGLIAAVGAAAIVGALVALPAIRLQGLYLALATLAFGAGMDYAFFQLPNSAMNEGSFSVGRSALFGNDFGSDRSFLLLVVGVFALAAIGVLALRRSRFGRRLVALNDSPAACATVGISLTRTKLAVFAFSAGLAGLAGALYGGVTGLVGTNDFQLLSSLTLLLLAMVWGIRSTCGVLLAGLSFVLLPEIPHVSNLTYLVTGLGAITISRNSDGALGEIIIRLASFNDRRRPPSDPKLVSSGQMAPAGAKSTVAGP